MSFTIHSIPRRNLPQSTARLAMRAIAGVQDARTFQEARDALLRYYYPILRSRRRIDEKTPQDFENAENWTLDLLHSGSKTSAQLFCERALGRESKQATQFEQNLQTVVEHARKDTGKTPYERVGDVLAWLKDARREEPTMYWSNLRLREWMQGLLTDFTLVDAKKRPGALVPSPEQKYEALLASWEKEGSGLPFNYVWQQQHIPGFGHLSATQNFFAFNEKENQLHTGALARQIRAKLLQESPDGIALMMHSNIGVTRMYRPTWRDVTDYGVLHPLLTLDEASFDKKVWIDWLQHQGQKWSDDAHEETWYGWQEKAQASYQRVLQGYYASTPEAVVYRGGDEDNPLTLQAQCALPIDWYQVATQLANRFPYLNQSKELDELARTKLSPTEYATFVNESSQRLGQSMMLSVMDLPTELEKANALNMPPWFHTWLASAMTRQTQLALPEGVVDDQSPSLY